MSNYTFEDETDHETDYGTDNETDYGTDDGETIYDTEEPTKTKNNIVICEKYNGLIHSVSSHNEMNSHFLTIIRFKKLDMNVINSFMINHNTHYNVNSKLEIAECIYLSSYHCISIIKTIWLKLIQRNWKRIIKERKLCISKRCNQNVINYREIYGKWPNDCLHYPSLRGMLFNLSWSFS